MKSYSGGVLCRAVLVFGLLGWAMAGWAGTHVWSGAKSGYWGTAGNWSSGGVPAAGEANLILKFPAGPNWINTTNNIAGLTISSLVADGDNYSISGKSPGTKLTFDSDTTAIKANGKYLRFDDSLTIELVNANTFYVDGNQIMLIDSPITGQGGFYKTGTGILELRNQVDNTFTGNIRVHNGTLDLLAANANGSGAHIAVPGNLYVGTTDSNLTATVQLGRNQQISPFATVFLLPNGSLLLQGATQTVSALELTGGKLDTASTTAAGYNGLLRVTGNVTENSPGKWWMENSYSYRGGRVEFFAGNHVWNAEEQVGGTWKAQIGEYGGAASFTKIGPGVFVLYGTNTFTGAMNINAGGIYIESAEGLGSTAGGTVVGPQGQLAVSGQIKDAIPIKEPLTLQGLGTSTYVRNGSYFTFTGAFCYRGYQRQTWEGPITLEGDAELCTETERDLLVLNGAITGPGELHKTGPGVLSLEGMIPITSTGAWKVIQGTLTLSKTSLFNPRGGARAAIPGPVVVGSPVGGDWPKLQLQNDGQFTAESEVTVLSNGKFDLNGFTTGMGTLTLHGGIFGDLSKTNGLLTLSGSLVAGDIGDYWAKSTARNIALTPGTHEIHIYGDNLELGYVSEKGGKASINVVNHGYYGKLTMLESNTFTGELHLGTNLVLTLDYLDVGSFFGDHTVTGFGSGNAAIILDDGTELDSYVIPAYVRGKPLQVMGTTKLVAEDFFYWDGPVSIATQVKVFCETSGLFENELGQLELAGPVSGPGSVEMLAQKKALSTMTVPSLLRLSGTNANTYQGETRIGANNVLELAKDGGNSRVTPTAVPGPLYVSTNSQVRWLNSNQVNDQAPVTLDYGAELRLQSFAEHIGSLEGVVSSSVSLGRGDLTVGANNRSTTFAGSIAGIPGSSFTKTGTGSLALTGNNTLIGSTIVTAGTLELNGEHATSPITVRSGATLTGLGRLGNVTSQGGIIIPGNLKGSLSVSNLTLDAQSQLVIVVNRTGQIGVPNNWLLASGAVALGDAQLNISLAGTPKTGAQHVILRLAAAQQLTGTFAGLPQGGVLRVGGTAFQIDYAANGGSNVTLTCVGPVGTPRIDPSLITVQNGALRFSASVVPGLTYNVLATSDPASGNWVPAGSVTAAADGSLSFTDPITPQVARRFYRLSLP